MSCSWADELCCLVIIQVQVIVILMMLLIFTTMMRVTIIMKAPMVKGDANYGNSW
jgi:hypothetical protein